MYNDNTGLFYSILLVGEKTKKTRHHIHADNDGVCLWNIRRTKGFGAVAIQIGALKKKESEA